MESTKTHRVCEICKRVSEKWATKKVCKPCYNKQWHKHNPDTRGPERHYSPDTRFKYGMRMAEQRKITWNISFDEYLIFNKQACHYCNNQLGVQINGGAGLDRIDNAKGYELGNILPCCKICNTLRNTYLSVEETEIAVKAIIDYRKSRVVL